MFLDLPLLNIYFNIYDIFFCIFWKFWGFGGFVVVLFSFDQNGKNGQNWLEFNSKMPDITVFLPTFYLTLPSFIDCPNDNEKLQQTD